jgi:hypothetical protein
MMLPVAFRASRMAVYRSTIYNNKKPPTSHSSKCHDVYYNDDIVPNRMHQPNSYHILNNQYPMMHTIEHRSFHDHDHLFVQTYSKARQHHNTVVMAILLSTNEYTRIACTGQTTSITVDT